NGTNDSCGVGFFGLDQYYFDCTHIGSNIVTLTITDVWGNTSTCQTQVFVGDSFPPVLILKNDSVYLDGNGLASNNLDNINRGTYDVCQLDTIWENKNQFSCIDLPSTQVKVKAQDVYGNIDSAFAQVFVFDTIKPDIICE